jgi:tellurite resistance protein TerC
MADANPVILLWTCFIAFILLLLALDLGVFHRRAHTVGFREAVRGSAVWLGLGASFSVFVWFAYENQWFGLGSIPDPVDGVVLTGTQAASKYLTGWLIEQSLSVDNLFVIAVIFSSFAVPSAYKHRLLFWGILGAIVLRGAMIGVGIQLIQMFHWLLFVFGGILVLTAIKLVLSKESHSDPAQSLSVRMTKRIFRVTDTYHGNRFIVWRPRDEPLPTTNDATDKSAATTFPLLADKAVARAPVGAMLLTPLAVALLTVEATDVVFAVDSIPAIFTITADPFLVFSSNIFAILGLRSLFFLLAGLLDRFHALRYSLAAILLLIGLKMFFSSWIKDAIGPHFNLVLLLAVATILGAGIAISLLTGQQSRKS